MDKSAGLEKSESAFRTIGEVSDEIGVPQHVLRYWETRFPQLKPITRAGNRRYYRPADVALVRRIHDLLGQEGYTVKGVQRLLAARPAAAGAPQPAAIMVPAQPAVNAPQPAVALSPASAMLAELIAIRERLKAALETSAA